MAVIGFLNYTDFIAELKAHPLWGQPVRVQRYHKSRLDKYGIRHFTFIVEAAIEITTAGDITNVLVCRFVIAKTNSLANNLQEMDRRTRRAADILRQALRTEGFTVSPGLIAAAADSQTETDPDDLWNPRDLAIEINPSPASATGEG